MGLYKASLYAEHLAEGKLGVAAVAGGRGTGDNFGGSTAPSNSAVADRNAVMCGSSDCLQANAVLVSPAISIADLGEVLDDAPVASLIR